MKKIISLVSLCVILLCTVILFSACGAQCAAPTNLKLDVDNQTLEWRKAVGARSYEIRVSGEDRVRTTQANYFALEYLEPGTYVVEVRAISADPEADPSDWVSFNYVREKESGLRYKLINNRTEYEVVGGGTAVGDVVMESVYRGKPVTSIAAKAFNNNRKITSMVIGENVKTIGKNAFNRCSEMVSITIPESVETIGEYAFQSCKKLTTVQLPSKLQSVEPYLFSWCSALTEVKMGENVASIGEYAFSNCEALATITMPQSMKTIGEYAFSDCVNLTNVSLGGGMESVSNYAFYNCSGITNLDMGQSVQTIGIGSFGNCTGLQTLVIPDSTKTIEGQAFLGCTALADVTLGTGLERIGSYAFYGTAIFEAAEDIFYLNGWAIANKNVERAKLTLEEGTYGIADGAFVGLTKVETITFKGVKYVGGGAFAGCSALWQIRFDDALLVLNESAFAGCSVMSSVVLGNSLTKLGDSCFNGCTVLQDTIDLPDSLVEIGSNCFNNTQAFNKAQDVVYIDDWAVGLKPTMYITNVFVKEGTRGLANYCFNQAVVMGAGIILPESLEIIGRAAFYNSMMLGGLGWYNSGNLRYIGDYAFYGCSNLWFTTFGVEGIAITHIPEGVEYIGRSAFYKCTAMVGVTIPSTCKFIGDYAFYGCINLGESSLYASLEDQKEGKDPLKGDVIIPEGVEHIGARAFHSCLSLHEIVIPNSVTYIGERAFYKCANLKKVVLGEGILDLPAYTFYKCETLVDLTISDSIKTIGDYAFRGCVELKNIQIGASVETIGNYAFYGCTEVSEIILPASVKTIGNFAFRGCAKVDSVILADTIEVIGKHAFYGLNKASFFCESETIKPYWHERWNSSYRTVFWGCTLSEDNSYVVSVIKSEATIDNIDAADTSLMPEREGYELDGWSLSPDSDRITYNPRTLTIAPDGTVLYAVWKPVKAAD